MAKLSAAENSLSPFENQIVQMLDQESNPSLKGFRRDSLKSLRDMGLPSMKTEGWRHNRFSKYSKIASTLSVTSNQSLIRLQWQGEWIDQKEENDYFTWSKVSSDDLSRLQCSPASRVVLREINSILHQEAWHLKIKKSLPKGAAIKLDYSSQYNQAGTLKLFVDVDEGVVAKLVEGNTQEEPSGGKAFGLSVEKNIKLAKKSHLGFYTNLNLTKSAIVFTHFADVHTHAKLDFISLNKAMEPNSFFRSEYKIRLKEEQARVHFSLGAIADQSDLQLAHVLHIDHEAPRTFSDQKIRAIVGSGARYYFNGRVHIHEGASQSEANQLNKNLLLDGISEVDTLPELIIDHDDVSCSHGASVSELDTEHLHYLMSRGIDKKTAHNLLVSGFISGIFAEDKIASELYAQAWQQD